MPWIQKCLFLPFYTLCICLRWHTAQSQLCCVWVAVSVSAQPNRRSLSLSLSPAFHLLFFCLEFKFVWQSNCKNDWCKCGITGTNEWKSIAAFLKNEGKCFVSGTLFFSAKDSWFVFSLSWLLPHVLSLQTTYLTETWQSVVFPKTDSLSSVSHASTL